MNAVYVLRSNFEHFDEYFPDLYNFLHQETTFSQVLNNFHLTFES